MKQRLAAPIAMKAPFNTRQALPIGEFPAALAPPRHRTITSFGRHVRLKPDDRGSVNNLVQAADISRHAVLAVDRALPDAACILLPHHDALPIDCSIDEADRVTGGVMLVLPGSFDLQQLHETTPVHLPAHGM